MYHLTAIGNAPVDVLTHVKEELLTKYNLKKGDFQPVSADIFTEIADLCAFEGMESGGSTANTAWTLAMMGKKIHFIGHVGNDTAGQHFYKDMQLASVDMSTPNNGAQTMEILVLITPDGERTFISKGVTAPLEARMVSADIIQKSQWLLIEGYILLDQVDAVKASIEFASTHQTKIAFTISAPFVIQMAFAVIKEILPHVDLLIANKEEEDLLMAMVDKIGDIQEKETLLNHMKNMAKIITHGPKGATFTKDLKKEYRPTTAVKNITDATGAGDSFAAGFLYGYMENHVSKGLTLGHKLGGKIIQQLGGRMKDTSLLIIKKDVA